VIDASALPLEGTAGVPTTSLPGVHDSLPRPDGAQEQFESIFYSILVKQLRSSLSENGLFPGEGTDSYGALFDQMMGQHLAQAQPLGIAKLLERYREAAAAG
jgi:hypothetical protein